MVYVRNAFALIGVFLVMKTLKDECFVVTNANVIAKAVAVYRYAYQTVVLFCNTTGS